MTYIMTNLQALDRLQEHIDDYLSRLKPDNYLYCEDNGDDELIAQIRKALERLNEYESNVIHINKDEYDKLFNSKSNDDNLLAGVEKVDEEGSTATYRITDLDLSDMFEK